MCRSPVSLQPKKSSVLLGAMQQGQEEFSTGESLSPTSGCAICSSGATEAEQEQSSSGAGAGQGWFALRCNCCRLWYHPWCMGYQLDLDRSCLITASDVDIPIDPETGLPLACQWFCDSCASTVTGVVAATASRRQRPAVPGSSTPRRYLEQEELRFDRRNLVWVARS